MLGVIVIFVLLGIELGFMVYSLKTKSEQRKVKHVIRICELALFCLLVMIRVVQLNFRWYMLFIILLIQAIIGIVSLVKKSESIKFLRRNMQYCLLLTVVCYCFLQLYHLFYFHSLRILNQVVTIL